MLHLLRCIRLHSTKECSAHAPCIWRFLANISACLNSQIHPTYPNRGSGGPAKGPRFCVSVPQKRHAPGGTHFCLLRRSEILPPWPLLRLADFCGAPRWALAQTGALRQPRLRCFVHWTRSARLPGQKRKPPHASRRGRTAAFAVQKDKEKERMPVQAGR